MVPGCVTTCYHHCTPRNAHSPGSKSLPVALQLRDVRCGAQQKFWKLGDKKPECRRYCRYTKHHPNLESCNKKRSYFFFTNLCFFVRDARRFFFQKKTSAFFVFRRKGASPETKSHVPLRKAMVPWSLFLSVPMCVAYASSLGASNAREHDWNLHRWLNGCNPGKSCFFFF